MIELKDLQLLAALARHQHFAKAAQDCGISQPAFSMRIRNMEDKLGVSIVRRANRFQGLTEEGQMILRRTRGILDDVKALEQEIAASRGEISGVLVLGVVPTAMAYAAQLVVQLLSSHPKILPRIESTTSLAIQRRLYDGTIDAGITYDDSLGRDMVTLQPLYDETYVLLAPEHMVADFTDSIRWAEAAELPLCLLDTQMQNRRILDRVFGDLGLKPLIVSEANGFMAAMVMARLGSAATIVPRALVDALGALGGTRVLDLIDPVQARPICIATLDRTPELTTVRALKALVAGFSR
ncbi:MAG: LysR family transcriptional regulator [Rhodobacteraceae bacterium]|nr:LysR family transcriptional regulator [Paracoccaceae bacterium]